MEQRRIRATLNRKEFIRVAPHLWTDEFNWWAITEVSAESDKQIQKEKKNANSTKSITSWGEL
jgi:hypothetical protein